MSLLNLIIVLFIAGFVCWVLLQTIPMPAPFQHIIIGVICLFMVLWVLQSLGLTNTHLRLR